MTRSFPPPVFQSFDDRTSPKTVARRVRALRAELEREGLDAFLVPRADVHRGESVPESEARLAFVTSFTGSAGLAIIGRRKAGLFVDSRYALQAPAQTDTRVVTVIETAQGGLSPRIAEFVSGGGRVGYDPWLHTPSEIRDLGERLKGKATLKPVDNLVDRIWSGRPQPPSAPAELIGHNRSGRRADDKLAELRAELRREGADAVVLTMPESVNWLFNLRGRDVPHVPVVQGFAIVPKGGKPTVFLARDKITPELRARLGDLARLADRKTLGAALRRLAAAGKAVMVDPQTVPEAVVTAIAGESGASIIERRDPVMLPKARKNDAELGGMREAHRLDGVAMAKFLHWFDSEAPSGQLDEIGIVSALEAFRREEPSAVDGSFETIAGAGPHAAMMHYRVSLGTNRRLATDELMLVDSGAQYLSGTTDITRTMAVKTVSAAHRDRFTRVLKGMIAISRLRFPRGTTGAQIDVLARQALWEDGVNFAHGTGHGVGAYLSVHEGPIGISPRYTVPFEPGMIVSNEPGYYEADGYGIRIENLIAARESPVGGGKYLEWETLTLAPIDRRLIVGEMLDAGERAWLDAYHARVLAEIGPLVPPDVRKWLEAATAPL